jgi:NodT family efflux transporter outer membrane factor (OMF) lipoprotein
VTAWPQARWWEGYGDLQLNSLIAEVLRNAPSMAQAAARLQRAQALASQSEASFYPAISADVSMTEAKPSTENGIPVTPARQGWNDYGKASISFSWEIDFWGKNRAAVAAATSDAKATEADAAAARLVLSTAVAASYADLARLFADREVLAATLAIRERSLSLVRARTVHGFDSDADLAQAEAGPPAARADLAVTDEGIALVRNRIAALLGAGPDRGLGIDKPAHPILGSLALPPNLPSDLLGRRPDIVAARWRTEAAARRIDVAHAQFYPSVNLLGFIGLDALGLRNIVNNGADTGSAGAAVTLPIFDGGRRRASYRGARADFDLAVASYDDTVTQALREVADAVQSRHRLDVQIQEASAALTSTERAYRLAELRYSAGAADYQSVLIVEDHLLARRRILAALTARTFVLNIALVRALGGEPL